MKIKNSKAINSTKNRKKKTDKTYVQLDLFIQDFKQEKTSIKANIGNTSRFKYKLKYVKENYNKSLKQTNNPVTSSSDIQQLELNLVFDVSQKDNFYKIVEINEINGLKYIPEFITQSKHDDLLQKLDAQFWLSDLKRRVQHYGYKYNYKARIIDTSMQIGALPDWALELAYKLYKSNLIDTLPDQVIVNEYLPGQGITSHIDCVPCFTDTIISLSLGSCCVMDFTNVLTGEKIPILLEPKSIVILKEDARYKWTHSIAPRKVDKFQGQVIRRERRVSLTFRKVILAG